MKGMGASQGIAIGRAYIDWRETIEIEKEYVEDAILEVDRLVVALESVLEVTPDFQVDREFLELSRSIILTEKVVAPWALQKALRHFSSMLLPLEEHRRIDSMTHLAERLSRLLLHLETVLTPDDLPGPRILVCKTVTREDLSLLREGKVIGLVCEGETNWSHGVIAARDQHIPAVIGLESITEVVDQGDLMVIDGDSGEVLINPDSEKLATYSQRLRQQEEFEATLSSFRGKTPRTADGTVIKLQGNASTLADAQSLAELQVAGVGLYRTEYLYLSRDKLPSEGEQYYDYKRALAAFPGSQVVVRTFDVACDRLPPYLSMPKENNPAMGRRAIRFSLTRVDLFREQLRALLRASALGDLGVMLPLVSSVAEVRAARAVLEDLKEEFRREDLQFNQNMRLGVMVETPAAALEVDLLAPEVDFFSIGSNDLVQYTLASDRNNRSLANLYSPFAPAALRLISYVIQKANELNVPVNLCGEMAGNPLIIPLLYGMGLRHFSVNPHAVLRTHWVLASLHREQCEAYVREALTLPHSEAIRSYCEQHFAHYLAKE